MKKISYFLVLFISIFSLNMLVSAETCNYSKTFTCRNIDGSTISSDSDSGGCFIGGYPSGPNGYLEMISYALYKKAGISKNDVAANYSDLSDHILSSIFKNMKPDGVRITDINLKYEIGSNKYTVTFYFKSVQTEWVWPFKNGSIWFGAEPVVKSNSISFTFDAPQPFNYCTDTFYLKFFLDGYEQETIHSMGANIPISYPKIGFKVYYSYMKNSNYDILELMAKNNEINDKFKWYSVVLYNETINVNPNKKQNAAQFLNAVRCTTMATSSAFVSDDMDAIKEIIDKAANTSNSNYNIRTIYQKIVNMNKDEARVTIQNIVKNGMVDTEEARMMLDYMTTLPYFKETSKEKILSSIRADKQTLNDFKTNYSGSFEDCLTVAYNTDNDVNSATKLYMEYDPDYQGLYIDAMINLLDIFDSDDIDKWIEAIKERSYVNDKMDECKSGTETDQRRCAEDKIKAEIEGISCSDLATKIKNGDQLTMPEQILNNIILKNCSKNDFQCLLNQCEKNKDARDIDKQIDEIIDGTTDAQKGVKDDIGKFYSNTIEHGGIKIEAELCNVFDGALGEYILLGLNIIRIGGPILVIILTGFDAAKTFTSSKTEEESKKFFSKLKTRLILVAVLFIVPTIAHFLANNFLSNLCENDVTASL